MTSRRLRIDHLVTERSLFVEDDLIEIESPPTGTGRTRTRTRNTMNLELPHPDSWPIPDLANIPGLIPPRPRRMEGRRPPEPTHTQSGAAVIDLTEEPDSPVRERPRRNSSHQAGRNPRRTNSQRISPPRLARSDSTFFGASASVIDLTVDSPEESRPSDSTRSRTAHHRVRPHPDELIELEFISSGPITSGPRNRVPNFAIGLTRRLAGILGAEIMGAELLGFNQPNLDISRNAFAPREPSPKPPMEPMPPTREGFSRETCTDPEKESETIVICPACNEELAYDPTEPVVHTSPSGGKKRKRSPGEHHFWALKKCGHVYCADCFENRRPTKTNPMGAGFRAPEGKIPCNVPNELRCVVDDCDTKVSAKGEWVGIFL